MTGGTNDEAIGSWCIGEVGELILTVFTLLISIIFVKLGLALGDMTTWFPLRLGRSVDDFFFIFNCDKERGKRDKNAAPLDATGVVIAEALIVGLIMDELIFIGFILSRTGVGP
jgi:hypothetical protein